jgi:hypothetical protein
MAVATNWLKRQYHWLLPRHGSLARRWDRIEAAVVLSLLVLAILAVPAAVATGADYHTRQETVAAAQRAERQPARAVLLAPTSPATATEGGSVPDTEGVAARWEAGGAERTGTIQARAGLPAGASVDIWLDGAGNPVGPPQSEIGVIGLAVGLGALVWAAVNAVLAIAYSAVRFVLDNRRLAGWAREWDALDWKPRSKGDPK